MSNSAGVKKGEGGLLREMPLRGDNAHYRLLRSILIVEANPVNTAVMLNLWINTLKTTHG